MALQQRSHVPKFGNWDGDNVPYTAFFENARKEKTGVRINPNDPEQNPEAFTNNQIPPQKHAHHRINTYVQQSSVISHKSVASESSSDKSPSNNSGTSILNQKHQHKKSERNKYTRDSRFPPSPGPNYYKQSNPDDISFRSVSVPKFGEWDEKDPRSAEGFTVIFNKVKEEKQIAAARFSPVPVQNFSNEQTNQKRETKKRSCCLF